MFSLLLQILAVTGNPLTCSPEICDIPGPDRLVVLEPRTYAIDRQVLLPVGTRLFGAGIGRTIIRANGTPLGRRHICRNWNDCRRGFLLNNDTHLRGFTFIGRDSGRWGDNQCLTGGAPLGEIMLHLVRRTMSLDVLPETPGCQDSYCRARGDPSCGVGGERGPDFCTAGGCEGVSNVLVEDVEVAAHTTQTAVWMPLNPPGNRSCSNITFRGIMSEGTWADGVNVHGEHDMVVVENSMISNTGDDGFAMWSNGNKLTHVVFRNNTMQFPRWDGVWPEQKDCNDQSRPDVANGTWGVNCFAMYGGGAGNQIIDNKCVSTKSGLVVFHGAHPGDLGFHGNFSEDAVVELHGNTVHGGDGQGPHCCTDCPVCWWQSYNTSHWTTRMKPEVRGQDCVRLK